jgi:Tfp pilus assembly protein PilX
MSARWKDRGALAPLVDLTADQRGIALPMALFVLLILASLSVALLATGSNESEIAANHFRGVQATFTAEAGIEAAFGSIVAGTNVTSSAPSSWTAMTVPAAGTNLSPIGTYAVRWRSVNSNSVQIESTGTSTAGSARRVIKAVLSNSFTSEKAILTDGSLTLNGNPSVTGTCGAVHTNQDLAITGGSVVVTETATASGTATGTFRDENNNVTNSQGGQAEVTLPVVTADSLLTKAQNDSTAKNALYKLTQPSGTTNALVQKWNPATSTWVDHERKFSGVDQRWDGSAWVTTGTFTVLKSAGNPAGFDFSSGDANSPAKWTLGGNSAASGTFWAEGDINVSGNPGSGSGSVPVNITLIAKDAQPEASSQRGGNVSVSGNPQFTSHMTGISIMGDSDVEVSGNPVAGNTSYNGLIIAGEQIKVNGNPSISGSLIAMDAACDTSTRNVCSNAVTGNAVSGNPTINYDCSNNANLDGSLRYVTWGL